jgi:hypothetical protein
MYVYPNMHMYLMYGVFIRTNSAKPLSISHAVGSSGAASTMMGRSLRNLMVYLIGSTVIGQPNLANVAMAIGVGNGKKNL